MVAVLTPPRPAGDDHLAHSGDLLVGQRRQRLHRRAHRRPIRLRQPRPTAPDYRPRVGSVHCGRSTAPRNRRAPDRSTCVGRPTVPHPPPSGGPAGPATDHRRVAPVGWCRRVGRCTGMCRDRCRNIALRFGRAGGHLRLGAGVAVLDRLGDCAQQPLAERGHVRVGGPGFLPRVPGRRLVLCVGVGLVAGGDGKKLPDPTTQRSGSCSSRTSRRPIRPQCPFHHAPTSSRSPTPAAYEHLFEQVNRATQNLAEFGIPQPDTRYVDHPSRARSRCSAHDRATVGP